MDNVKKQGFIFPVQDKAGNLLHNIFIDLADINEGRKYEKILSQMNDTLYQIFGREEHIIEILPVFDIGQTEGAKLHIFFIELFLSSKGNFNRSLFENIILKIKQGKKNYLPDLTCGAVTRGVDFFNQEDFILKIWASLKDKHIILIAPRKFGKTSILYHLLDNPKNGFSPLHIDLEGVSDATSFVCEVMLAYRRWIMKEFEGKSEQKIDEEKKELCASLKADWQQKWEAFCLTLNRKILFLFDEFTLMLENITDKTEAHNLLTFIHQTIHNLKEARCIITGSILIKRIIDKLDYRDKEGFYSFFEEKRLPALSPEDGYELTQILLAGIGIRPTSERVETILNLIGSPIPFFIQLLVFEIEKGLMRENIEPSSEDIKRVYQERLLGAECKSYFRHYYDHLKRYELGSVYPLPGLKDIFEELTRGNRTVDELKPIFKQRCPRSSDDDFHRVMEYLEDEFYIKDAEGRYTFTCNLIRDWWLRHSRYLDTEKNYGKGTV